MFIKRLPIFLVIGLLMAACGNNNQGAMHGPAAPSVVVQAVGKSDAFYYEDYPAVIKALNEVELRAQVSGYITGIHFKEGDQVRKGQKLYTIDQQQSMAIYNQAVANLSVQEANLERAKKDAERYRELDKQDAIAKQQVDYAEAAYEAAQRQVEAAKAAVRGAQTSVRYTTIEAPFDGTIGISNVRLGAAVTPGQTLLNTISSDDPVAADVTVDQQEIFRFSQLMNSQAKADSAFRLAFKDEVYPMPGKITVIDRAVDAQTGSIRMRLEFPNAQHMLRPGMNGTLKVLTHKRDAVVIPFKAVNEQLGEFFVYLADSSKATQRKVKLGQQVGKDIIVSDGLKEGEVLITEGIQNLREGTPITIFKPEAKQ